MVCVIRCAGRCRSGCTRAHFGRYNKWYSAIRFVAWIAKSTRQQHRPPATKGERSEAVAKIFLCLVHTCLVANKEATHNLPASCGMTCVKQYMKTCYCPNLPDRE